MRARVAGESLTLRLLMKAKASCNGGLLAPELVDQPLGGEHLVRVQREHCEKCASPTAADRQRLVGVSDLERPEEADLHWRNTSRGERNTARTRTTTSGSAFVAELDASWTIPCA
jgi:hypothetical protein